MDGVTANLGNMARHACTAGHAMLVLLRTSVCKEEEEEEEEGKEEGEEGGGSEERRRGLQVRSRNSRFGKAVSREHNWGYGHDEVEEEGRTIRRAWLYLLPFPTHVSPAGHPVTTEVELPQARAEAGHGRPAVHVAYSFLVQHDRSQPAHRVSVRAGLQEERCLAYPSLQPCLPL